MIEICEPSRTRPATTRSKRRERPGAWVLLTRPELDFGEGVLVPDLAAWRTGLRPLDPSFPTCVPDWICEVTSPTSRAGARDRFAVYAREGVAHAWLLDGDLRKLEVYVNEDAKWLLTGAYAAGATLRAAPFDEMELELASLWRDRTADPDRSHQKRLCALRPRC
jgi:Uma2 family endonuclease